MSGSLLLKAIVCFCLAMNVKSSFEYEPLPIEKLNNYFITFHTSVRKEDTKSLYKQLKWLSLDADKFMHPSKVLSSQDIDSFVDTGLSFVHKKFDLDSQSLEHFLQQNLKTEQEITLETNVADDKIIKASDWKRIHPKIVKRIDQLPKPIQPIELIVDEVKPSIENNIVDKLARNTGVKNSDQIRSHQIHVHPKFFDDEIEEEDEGY